MGNSIIIDYHGSRHAALRHVYPKSKYILSCPPPLRNPAYAPALYSQSIIMNTINIMTRHIRFCNIELLGFVTFQLQILEVMKVHRSRPTITCAACAYGIHKACTAGIFVLLYISLYINDRY